MKVGGAAEIWVWQQKYGWGNRNVGVAAEI